MQLSGLMKQYDHEVVFVSESLGPDTFDAKADVISIFVSSSLTADVIETASKLRAVACRSTGYNNIDMAAAKHKKLAIMNVPTYGTHTVAEYAFGLLLLLTRKIPEALEEIKGGIVNRSALQGSDLYGKTFGVVGAGRIGTSAARIARGFGMNVLAYDVYPDMTRAEEVGFTYVDIETLLRDSDIVSLHAPYIKENHHLLNAERIKMLKHGAIVLNTARGELIDNDALITALQSGHVAGAGLDVLEGEQLLDAEEELLLLQADKAPTESLRHSLQVSILAKMPNVVITNHNAFNTVEAIARINEVTTENILSFLSGKPQNIV